MCYLFIEKEKKKKKNDSPWRGKESAQLSISSFLMSFQTYPQFFNINLFLIILLIFACTGSLLLCRHFSS